MNYQKNIGIGCGVVLVALAGIVLSRHPHDQSTTSIPTVEVASVTNGEQDGTIMADGSFVPSAMANVNVLPSFTGQVTSVLVDVGSHVVKGQPLAIMDASTQAQVVESSQNQLQSARAAYALALNPHRPEEIQEAVLNVAQQKASVQSAALRLQLLQQGNLPQQVENSQSDVAKAQTDLDVIQARYNRDKQLSDQNLLPRVTLEQDEADLSDAQQSLSQAKNSHVVVAEGTRPDDVKIAELDLQNAKVSLASAQDNLAMLREGSRPEQITQAADSLSNAQIDLQRNQTYLSRAIIRAPISGVIISRDINVGEVASPGAAHSSMTKPIASNGSGLFTIGEDQTLDFTAAVDQMYSGKVRLGEPAEVQAEAMPGRVFHGTVERIMPLINPHVNNSYSIGNNVVNPTTPLTFDVWVRVPNPHYAITPGLTGFASLSNNVKGLQVPQNAVTSYSLGQGTVFVVQDGAIKTRQITYDTAANGQLHVLSGLKASDQVVVSHQVPLSNGMNVNTQAATADDFSGSAY